MMTISSNGISAFNRKMKIFFKNLTASVSSKHSTNKTKLMNEVEYVRLFFGRILFEKIQ